MSWLVGYVLASMAAAFAIDYIFTWVVGGVVGGLASIARASLFVSVWTAVTTGSGMRDFSKRVRQLRQRIGKR